VWLCEPPIRALTPNQKRGGARGSTKRSAQRRDNAPRNGRSASMVVHRPPIVRYTPNVFGFPDRLMTKLRYADVYNLASTVGSIGKQVIRWNSTFDPDLTGTGHQPLYRDTYASIYDHYAVIRAKITVRFDNPNAAIPFVCGMVTDDDSSSSSTWQTLIEQSHGRASSLTNLAGSHSSQVFTATWDAASVLNIDPFSDETYKTSVGGNPTEDSNLIIWSLPFDGTSTATIQVYITLEQEVLWTELTTPTQS
jgi:hypothetical protein